MTSGMYPKWCTPERRQYLIELFAKYNHVCLQGHFACRILEHYVHSDSKLMVKYLKTVPAIASDGHHITDGDGHKLNITVFPATKVIERRLALDNLYDLKSEDLIKYWIGDDREHERLEWELERQALHRTSDRQLPLRGRFSGIARDVWHDTQPLFYLESLGISALTFKPFAKIRLASSGTRLYVDITGVLKPLSKHAKRKAIRHAKSENAIQNEIHFTCSKAVQEYLKFKVP